MNHPAPPGVPSEAPPGAPTDAPGGSPEGAPATNTPGVERWPYPRHEYLLRVLWGLTWATAWQLCWKRVYFLRPLLLRLFGAKVSLRCHIAASVRIFRPWDLTIGPGCAIGPRTHLYNLGPLTLGTNTVLSQDVYLCGGTHDYTDPVYPLLRLPITVGSHAWVAAGAFVHPNVTIGDGAVVGARAVVTRDVPPWTVVAGNPAKVIKPRRIKNQINS